MSLLSYDRYCGEITAQTGLLRSTIGAADLLDFWLERVSFG